MQHRSQRVSLDGKDIPGASQVQTSSPTKRSPLSTALPCPFGLACVPVCLLCASLCVLIPGCLSVLRPACIIQDCQVACPSPVASIYLPPPTPTPGLPLSKIPYGYLTCSLLYLSVLSYYRSRPFAIFDIASNILLFAAPDITHSLLVPSLEPTHLCFVPFRRYLFLLCDDKRVSQRQDKKVNDGATRIEIKARDKSLDPWKLTCLSCSAPKKDPQTGAKTSPGKKQHPSNGLTPQPPQFANLTPSPHPSTLTTWPSLLCAIQI